MSALHIPASSHCGDGPVFWTACSSRCDLSGLLGFCSAAIAVVWVTSLWHPASSNHLRITEVMTYAKYFCPQMWAKIHSSVHPSMKHISSSCQGAATSGDGGTNLNPFSAACICRKTLPVGSHVGSCDIIGRGCQASRTVNIQNAF